LAEPSTDTGLTPQEQAELAGLRRSRAERKANCRIKYLRVQSAAVPFFSDTRICQALTGGMRSQKSSAWVLRTASAATQIEPDSLPGLLANMPKPPFGVRVWCEDLKHVAEEVLVPLLRWMIPRHFWDAAHGKGGYNSTKGSFKLRDGCFWEFMTYNMEMQSGAAASREITVFDEVPPQKLFWSQFMRILEARVRNRGGMIFLTATIDPLHAGSRQPLWVERVIKKNGGKDFGWYELSTQESMRIIEQDQAEDTGMEPGRAAAVLEQYKRILPADEYAVGVLGQGARMTGQVYRGFSDTENVYDVPGMRQAEFQALVQHGYGVVFGGMDYGKSSGVTAVVYDFVAKRAIPELKIAEGDYIQVDEYYRAGAHIPQHLPRLQELHRRWNVRAYWGDPHMWDKDQVVRGLTAAGCYNDPTLVRELIKYLPAAQQYALDDVMPVGPLRRGNNDVDAGIQAVSAMLMPRTDPPWPRLRMMKHCKYALQGFEEWALRDTSDLSTEEERFHKHAKDQMDARRYLVMGRPDRIIIEQQADIRVPADTYTGISMFDLFSLRGAM